MIKKLLLALILLVLLVGLSYVKIVRKKDQIDNAFTEGKQESENQLSRVRLDNDSLASLITQKESEYNDSISMIDLAYKTSTDSLISQIDSLGGSINELQNKLKNTETKLAKANGPTKSVSKKSTPGRHEQILTSYKKKYRSLPSDLSNYEKKVAIAEIRTETANQYKITVAELNRLRSNNNIDF